MSRAWLLPEHLADVLPAQARSVESLRRRLLDKASSRGFELVIPPLLEHLDSLLSGTGHELDLKTFKLVDQLSGRTLGLRADTTPQAARIDAHLLNRQGVTRLCYCGPVLHARPSGQQASREPLQFGAEIFGHAGLEADLEVQDLAIDGLTELGVPDLTIDLSDARILQGVLAGLDLDAAELGDLVTALSNKDSVSLAARSGECPATVRHALAFLLKLYGDESVLQEARQVLPAHPLIERALDDLRDVASHLRLTYPRLRVGFDLSDLSGYAYYSGTRFALFGSNSSDALARGGRYDEVGSIFGRSRPAVGFSLDVKVLAERAPCEDLPRAIRAPWVDDLDLRALVRQLRDEGQTVIFHYPGQMHDAAHPLDRELVRIQGRWVVKSL